jgi:hypothetical protein
MYGIVLLNSFIMSMIAILVNKTNPLGFVIWPGQSANAIWMSVIWLLFSSIDVLQVLDPGGSIIAPDISAGKNMGSNWRCGWIYHFLWNMFPGIVYFNLQGSKRISEEVFI